MVQLKINNDVLVDNRIVQRNIRSERLTREEYEQYLASLPDLRELCEDIGDEVYRSRKPGLALSGDFVSGEHDEE